MRVFCQVLSAAVLACIAVGGCESREDRLAILLLDFQAQSGSEDLERDGDLLELAALDAFHRGMTPLEVQGLLGEPDTVWDDMTPEVAASLGFDRRDIYMLNRATNLFVEFKGGKLVCMYRHVEGEADRGGGIHFIELAEPSPDQRQ